MTPPDGKFATPLGSSFIFLLNSNISTLLGDNNDCFKLTKASFNDKINVKSWFVSLISDIIDFLGKDSKNLRKDITFFMSQFLL